jgi:hypothetical protein
MPIPPSKPKAALAERLFVSASTVTFTGLMVAVILALQLGRI